MSNLVPREDIERIVGASRDQSWHIAKAVRAEQTVYILHPHTCLALHDDLRDCPCSQALDWGIDPDEWVEDVPLYVRVEEGLLVPGAPVSRPTEGGER